MRANTQNLTLGRLWRLIQESWAAWLDDYAPSMGAALVYYTIFSLAPLLILVVAIGSLVFGEQAARGELVGQLRDLLGENGATAVQALITSTDHPAKSITASMIGVVTLLVGATSVLSELQTVLNRIWRAPQQSGGWRSLLRGRLLSGGLILSLGFLLLVSLVIGAVLSAIGAWWGSLFRGWRVVLEVVNVLVGFAITTALFAMIYKILPSVRVAWRDVWIGAIVTALLFTVGKSAIGFYLGTTGVTSGFGAAGSLVVILAWVYYSAQIFLLGAEFTWVFAHSQGSRTSEVQGPAPMVPSHSDCAVATPARADTGE